MKSEEPKSGEKVKSDAKELRARASKVLEKKDILPQSYLSTDDIKLKAAIEELRIYHAELQLQNQTLQNTVEKLEEAKQRYQNLFDKNPLPTVLIDKLGVIQQLNAAAMSLFDLQYPARRLHSLYHYTEHESGEDIADVLNHVSQSENANVEIRLRRPESRIIDLSISEFEQNRTSLFLLVFNDVTENRKLISDNQLLSKAASETTSGIVITDVERKVVWVNQAFSMLTGYELDEVKGKVLGPILQGEKTNPETANKIRKSLAQYGTVDVDIINYHKSGRDYWVNLKINTVFEGNTPKYFVGIQHDITQQKEQLQTIIGMQRQDMAGQMAVGVAHDFNNILGVIAGNSEIAELKNSNPDLSKHFNKIQKALDRATSLTSKLLKTAKTLPESSATGLLIDVLNDSKDLTADILPSNVAIEWDIDAVGDERINVNEFEDVLLNLIMNSKNAITHHGKIDVVAHRHSVFNESEHFIVQEPEPSDEFLVICIKDDGKGIPTENLNRVFEPFKTFSAVKGTGLGLAMVLGFIKRNNYGLTVDSKENEGTLMSIYIPTSNASYQPIIDETNITDSRAPSNLNIVLIDNEIDLLDVTKEVLKLSGHNVLAYDDAATAKNQIISNEVSCDLIITDEVMPGDIQGLDLVKEFYGVVPILLISGYCEERKELNIDYSLLAKPFNKEQLDAAIKKVMMQ